MTQLYFSGTVDCRLFRDWAYHLQAGEVAEPHQTKLQAHVDSCESCSSYLEVERSFLRGLRKRLKKEEAPAGLEARIREALEREAPAVRWSEWVWPRSAVASALAAAVLLVALIFIPRTLVSQEHPGAMRVNRAVTIVDGDCDKAGATIAQQMACRDARHVNVLKVADGMYWNVNLDRPAARDIVLDPRQRGRRVVVEADYYPVLRTVHLIRVREPATSKL